MAMAENENRLPIIITISIPITFLFIKIPPKIKKCANRSQRTKNANSDSR